MTTADTLVFEYVRNDDGKVHDTLELKKQWNYIVNYDAISLLPALLYNCHRWLPKLSICTNFCIRMLTLNIPINNISTQNTSNNISDFDGQIFCKFGGF